MELGDVDGAVAILEARIAAARNEPALYAADHLNLFYLLARSGRRTRALEALHAAAAADPAYCKRQLPGLVRALSQGAPNDDAAFWSDVETVRRQLGL